jgi:alpha-L-fucosidase
VNGEAIYGTTYGPLQALAFGRTTAKGKNIYLHVFDWPSSGELDVAGLLGKVRAVTWLAGNRTIQFHKNGDTLALSTKGVQPDPYVTVFRLSME